MLPLWTFTLRAVDGSVAPLKSPRRRFVTPAFIVNESRSRPSRQRTVKNDPALARGRTSRIKPSNVGTGLKLDRISHVENLQVVAFYELELLAKLLVPDRALGSFPQQ